MNVEIHVRLGVAMYDKTKFGLIRMCNGFVLYDSRQQNRGLRCYLGEFVTL